MTVHSMENIVQRKLPKYCIRFDLEHQSLKFFSSAQSIIPIRFSSGSDCFVSPLMNSNEACMEIVIVLASSFGVDIDVGYVIQFNLQNKTIQYFKAPGSSEPIQLNSKSYYTACSLITDADSCFQLAGIISAVLGLIIGEGIRLDDTVTYEFKAKG